MDFIDKNLELEIGWALNPIRGKSSSVRHKPFDRNNASHSNSLAQLSRMSYATLHKKGNKSLQVGISPFSHRMKDPPFSQSRKTTYEALPIF